MAACKSDLSARLDKTRHYINVRCCSLKILPSNLDRSLSIVQSDGVNQSMCPPPPPKLSPTLWVLYKQYSKWSWKGGFPFLLRVSLHLQLGRIMRALRCLQAEM